MLDGQEFALSAAIELQGHTGVAVLCGGTDGSDGPTEATGAVVDGDTATRGHTVALDAAQHLRDNDSHSYFHALDAAQAASIDMDRPDGVGPCLLVTGPTGTNVMDVVVCVAQRRTID